MGDSGVGEHEISAVARRVVARLDRGAVAQTMVKLYVESFPSYAALARSTRDGALLDAVARGVDESLALFVGDPPGEADPRDPVTAPIERHTALGIPASEVVEAISRGGPLVWQAILAASEPDDLPFLTDAAMRWQRYLAAGKHAGGIVEPDGEAASRVLFDLLAARQPPAPVLENAGRAAGIDLRHGRWSPLVVMTRSDSAGVLERCAAGLRENDHPAVVHDRGVRAIVAAQTLPAMTLPARTAAAIGADRAPADLHEGLRETERLARVAVEADREGLLRAEELAAELLSPAALLESSPAVGAHLADRVLGPLRRHDERPGSDLVATLASWVLHDLQVGPAARAMHLHPNSMSRRLERISELTGLSVGRCPDRLAITLAGWLAAAEAPRP